MRDAVNALVTEKALALVRHLRGGDVVEMLPGSALDAAGMKNVCARVSPVLADEIDEVVSLLGCSKRVFLEAAFLNAVRQAKSIFESEGVYEELEARSKPAGVFVGSDGHQYHVDDCSVVALNEEGAGPC